MFADYYSPLFRSWVPDWFAYAWWAISIVVMIYLSARTGRRERELKETKHPLWNDYAPAPSDNYGAGAFLPYSDESNAEVLRRMNEPTATTCSDRL